MDNISPSNHSRLLWLRNNAYTLTVSGALLLLALFYFSLLYRNIVIGRLPYVYGDWVINYSGGFIRRGLGGETILAISSLTGLNIVQTTFALVALLFSLTFGALSYLLFKFRSPYLALALCIPSGLLFFFLEFGNIGRKDILIYLFSFVSAAITLKFSGLKQSSALLLICLFTTLAIFIHEGIYFYAPFIFLLLFISLTSAERSKTAYFLSAGLFLILTFLMWYISANTSANAETISKICSRLGDFTPLDCTNQDGAIGWLGASSDYSRDVILNLVKNENYLDIYAPATFFSVFILFIFSHGLSLRSDIKSNFPKFFKHPFIHILLMGLGTLPLFIVAIDWGRWIALWYIQAITYIFILYASDWGEGGILRQKPSGIHTYILLLFPLLSTPFWSVPVCCGESSTLLSFPLALLELAK